MSEPRPEARGEGGGVESRAAPLVEDLVSLFDAFVDYFTDILRLQGFRFGRSTRGYILRLGTYAAAAGIALFGVILLSLGCAGWVGKLADSREAGLAIVGAVDLLIALALVLVLGRRGPAPEELRDWSVNPQRCDDENGSGAAMGAPSLQDGDHR